jgi:diaminopimelate decarboxylase
MNAALKPEHAPHLFEVADDCLRVGGIPLTLLARRVGRTPFFAIDRALCTARVRQLRAALPPEVALHYSIKANPMPALVQHMAGLVDGLDVASGGELKTALDTGFEPARISFAGPGKLDAELAQAVAAGVCINVESARELALVARLGEEMGVRALVALRINPDFELKSSGMRMGGGAKPFGIDAEQAPPLLREAARLPLELAGLHIFCGSQSLNAQAIIEAQTSSVELALRLTQEAGVPLRHLNIGGGLGIPYFPGEARLDPAAIGANLARLAGQLQAAHPGARLAIELGRHLVGEAGIYVARVVDRKVSRGQVFLVTDGGMHHHLAASGNLGQVIRKNYPAAVGNRMAGDGSLASAVGPLCTPLDILADRMALGHAQVGDLIVVFQSGAYGPSASPANFLNHPPALEVLV